jgi:hypothetical protein
MLEHLFYLAIVAMGGLAMFRLARVLLGRTPFPGGRGGLVFTAAFLVIPPLALDALIEPAGANQLHGIQWVPVYVVLAGAVAILMGLLALVVGRVATGHPRRLLLGALVGSEGIEAEAVDPPLTAGLAEGMLVVDRTNAAFPRGLDFSAQVGRDGFRSAWDALDVATTMLEGRIADDRRLGLGAASAATATARDARGRLDTLRRLADDDGQAWAAV